jgi:hypothetical protein
MWAFDYPQTYAVTGSAEEQIAQLRAYIWQLVDALNQMGGDQADATGGGDASAPWAEIERLRQMLRAVEANSGRGNGTVTSVNRVLPDTAGNVQLEPEDVGAVDEDEEMTILEIVDMWNNA